LAKYRRIQKIDEWKRVEFFQYRGPTDEPWPKKPRVDFKKLEETRKWSGQELHNYLAANRAISDEVVWPETPTDGF